MASEWNNYQNSTTAGTSNSAKWRIDHLNLKRFAGKDKTLLDIGANIRVYYSIVALFLNL